MNFIDKILKESKLNYKQKFIKKRLNNQTAVSDKKLSLNNDEINFRFIKINNDVQKDKYLKCSRFENFRVCYLMTWVNEFNTKNYIEQIDLVICDLEWKVLKFYKSLPIDSEIKFDRNCHIFIMAHNSIAYNSIKVGDYLRPF